MRPLSFYTIFEYGKIIAICHGAVAARLASPHRSYKRFASQLAAEEYTAWWNFSTTE